MKFLRLSATIFFLVTCVQISLGMTTGASRMYEEMQNQFGSFTSMRPRATSTNDHCVVPWCQKTGSYLFTCSYCQKKFCTNCITTQGHLQTTSNDGDTYFYCPSCHQEFLESDEVHWTAEKMTRFKTSLLIEGILEGIEWSMSLSSSERTLIAKDQKFWFMYLGADALLYSLLHGVQYKDIFGQAKPLALVPYQSPMKRFMYSAMNSFSKNADKAKEKLVNGLYEPVVLTALRISLPYLVATPFKKEWLKTAVNSSMLSCGRIAIKSTVLPMLNAGYDYELAKIFKSKLASELKFAGKVLGFALFGQIVQKQLNAWSTKAIKNGETFFKNKKASWTTKTA